LAYFFNKLQLAQAEGQGIPTILRTMKEEGCPTPIFDIESESVTCILPAHPRHALLKGIHIIENEIILGKHEQASIKLIEILKNDLYNFRAIDLLCEISNILDKPEILLTFLIDNNIDFERLNAGTITNIADVIAQIKDNDKVEAIATKLMNYAKSVSLEEKQLEKLVISMKRLGQNEELVEFVNKAIEKNLTLSKNIILLENRARSKMDLAKICIDTGRNSYKYKNPTIRAKAWEAARKYLSEAERDLNTALENATSYVDKEYINKDLDFLLKMKIIAQRPDERRGHSVQENGNRGYRKSRR